MSLDAYTSLLIAIPVELSDFEVSVQAHPSEGPAPIDVESREDLIVEMFASCDSSAGLRTLPNGQLCFGVCLPGPDLHGNRGPIALLLSEFVELKAKVEAAALPYGIKGEARIYCSLTVVLPLRCIGGV